MDEESSTLLDASSSSESEMEDEFSTTEWASFGRTKRKMTSLFGDPPGSSPTQWLQGRSSVDAHDLHLDKWMPTGTIDRKNDRLWPFCIVATPNEIAVTARGEMVWIHYINGVLKTIIEAEEDIQGISATQDRLVVVGASTHLVYMYTMNGQLDFKFSTVQHEEVKDAVKQVAIWPWSVASKKNGAIIVGDVVRYVLTEHRPKDGKLLRTMQVKIKPEYLAVDDDDRILVSDRHTILEVDDSGSETFTQPTIDGRLAESYGLCCTKSAIYVIVSDDGGNTGRIHQYDKRGNFVESIALGLFRHMGITVTADQRYLAIASDYHVKIYKAKEHKVKSVFTETTSSKMPPRPTHKISDNTEDQRLQEPSHLKQVLDEVNKLAANLTASERLNSRLQLPYMITEDRVIHRVDHFTRFDLSGQSRKRLVVVPYGDVFDPCRGKYQLRVYVLHDNANAKKNVEKDEKHSKKLDGFKNLSWGQGDLVVKLSKLPQGCTVIEGETQTIHEKQIMEHASNLVTFTLVIPSRPADDILFCAAEIYQYCEEEDTTEQGKVQLSICPDKKTPDGYAVQSSVGAEAAACSQTLVGATSDETRTTLQDTVRRGFSQLQANQSASGDPCDFGGNLFSDTCKQVEKLLHTRPDTSSKTVHCGTVHGITTIYISKDGELVGDGDPEKTQLLKKPKVMEPADGDHASAVGSEPPSEMKKEQKSQAGKASSATESTSSLIASQTTPKEQIGKGVSIEVHGKVQPEDFGGLSVKAVHSLCYHLDCERNGASN